MVFYHGFGEDFWNQVGADIREYDLQAFLVRKSVVQT